MPGHPQALARRGAWSTFGSLCCSAPAFAELNAELTEQARVEVRAAQAAMA